MKEYTLHLWTLKEKQPKHNQFVLVYRIGTPQGIFTGPCMAKYDAQNNCFTSKTGPYPNENILAWAFMPETRKIKKLMEAR